MPAPEQLVRALATARQVRADIGREIRDARLNAGLSQTAAAKAVRMSHAQLGRIERGELHGLTVEQCARACAALGLKLVVRAYPDGEPIRDAAQIALLRRFRARLPEGAGWATEVPIPLPGDHRAWDAVARVGGADVAIEAETRVRDIQALDRRIALKRRDSGIGAVILVVNDSRSNRRAIHAARTDLRSSFPLDGRAILRELAEGRVPAASGIVLL